MVRHFVKHFGTYALTLFSRPFKRCRWVRPSQAKQCLPLTRKASKLAKLLPRSLLCDSQPNPNQRYPIREDSRVPVALGFSFSLKRPGHWRWPGGSLWHLGRTGRRTESQPTEETPKWAFWAIQIAEEIVWPMTPSQGPFLWKIFCNQPGSPLAWPTSHQKWYLDR